MIHFKRIDDGAHIIKGSVYLWRVLLQDVLIRMKRPCLPEESFVCHPEQQNAQITACQQNVHNCLGLFLLWLMTQ